MAEEEEIVTFATYYDPMLAEIIKSKLEAYDIPCFITDDNLGIMMPIYNQAIGGIKLKVFARDLEKCKEILNNDDDIANDDEEMYND